MSFVRLVHHDVRRFGAYYEHVCTWCRKTYNGTINYLITDADEVARQGLSADMLDRIGKDEPFLDSLIFSD